MDSNSFNYKSREGLVNINTLSPSGNFYYLVQEPRSLNPASFGCKIAFFRIDNKLIFHNKNSYAHELHNKEEVEAIRNQKVIDPYSTASLELVKWSYEGNMCYILEYYPSNEVIRYESVFINLKDSYCFRIDELINNHQIIDSLKLKDKNYNEESLIKTLIQFGVRKEALLCDPIKRFQIFGKNRWYPQIKIT